MAVTVANSPVVLIVEDHDDTREMLQLLLQVFGCRVIPAHDGEEAMSLVEKTFPDLILLDMRMPHLDGLSLARMIRSHPTLDEVPIIARRLARARVDNAWQRLEETGEVTTFERDVFELFPLDKGRPCGVRRLDECGFARDGHRLL